MKRILKNKVFLALLLLIITLSFTQKVNAFSTTMSLATTSELKPGSVVEVTLKILNIDAGDGIDAVVATLDYDRNIFDEVTEDNIEALNKWKVGGYNDESGEFTLQKSSKVNTASDVLTISLRVKDNVNVDKTTITFKNMSASGGAVEFGGTGDIEINEVSIDILKSNTSTENPPVANEIANEVVNEVTNEVTNTTALNVITNTVTNTTVTNTNNGGTTGRLPQTGENVATYIVGISIVTVIAIIAFIKYRNVNI